MKRVILANHYGSDFDTSINEPWVDDLQDEIKQFVKSEIKAMGQSKYYRCKIGPTEEDNYGYPVIIIQIYLGSRLTEEIQVGTFDTNNDTEIRTLDEDTKQYIRDELNYILQ